MLLNHVTIENFKGIEKCDITFDKGFNLLIGDNGAGKTSILEAISVGLGGFIAGIEDVTTRHFTKDEIRIVMENTGDGLYNCRYMSTVSVKCEALVDMLPYEWTRKKNSLKSSRTTVEPRDICRKAYIMANEPGYVLPVLNYQSAERMWRQKGQISENVISNKFYRTAGYESCLEEASNIKMLMNWIRHMEKQAWKNRKTIAEYEAVKNTLLIFMKKMSDDEVCGIEYDDRSDELVYYLGKEYLPIRALSAGYQSLIWMVLDIAFRMALLNPDMKEKINETPGVVLIDELDMHLHPKWQWNVVTALKETFPNVQFIAATHSPIIISSCKSERLIAVDAKKSG